MRATLRYNGESYSKEQLIAVGNDIAQLRGGFCVDAKVKRAESKVVFSCVENGEEILTSISFYELELRARDMKRAKTTKIEGGR